MVEDARTEPQETGIHVAQFLKEAVGATRQRSITLAQLPLDDGLVAREVESDVRLTRIPTGILAAGTARATVELTCMRCLEPFQQEVRVDYTDEFRPTVDIHTGVELAAVSALDDEEFFRIDGAHVVDVSEMLRQAFVLGMPMAPHCSEQCSGLLAVVAEDESQTDERLAILKLLLDPEAQDVTIPSPRRTGRHE